MAGQRRTSTVSVDAQDFLHDVEKNFADMRVNSRDGLRRVGVDIQNRARQLCPVDTGRLRSSIGMQEGPAEDENFYIDIGTGVAYAEFVEFGTSKAPAQPFLRPAFAEAANAAALERAARRTAYQKNH